MMFRCITHGVTMRISTNESGRTHRHIVQPHGFERPACALFVLKEPKSMEVGDLYPNPLTERSAYSRCKIVEE